MISRRVMVAIARFRTYYRTKLMNILFARRARSPFGRNRRHRELAASRVRCEQVRQGERPVVVGQHRHAADAALSDHARAGRAHIRPRRRRRPKSSESPASTSRSAASPARRHGPKTTRPPRNFGRSARGSRASTHQRVVSQWSVRGDRACVGLDVGEHAAAVPGREGPYEP